MDSFDDSIFTQPFGVLPYWVKHRISDKNEQNKPVEKNSSKNGFELDLNVEQFAREELKVETVNKVLIVKGEHVEKDDKGVNVSKTFSRIYSLPTNLNPISLKSNLSPNGILHISTEESAISSSSPLEDKTTYCT